MMRQILKGILTGFVSYIALLFSVAFYWSISFEGKCGFYSKSCSFIEFFMDNFGWALIVAFLTLPILVLLSIIISFIKNKYSQSSKWFYVIHFIVLIITFWTIAFDPFDLY